MKKSQIKIIIAGILIILLFFLILHAGSRVKKRNIPKPIIVTQAQPIQSEPVPVSEDLVAYSQNIAWGRDPFIQAPVRRGPTSGLVLEGIIWDEVNPQAIIGNEIVKVGDQVDGNRIIEIKKDQIILTDGKTEFTLEL